MCNLDVYLWLVKVGHCSNLSIDVTELDQLSFDIAHLAALLCIFPNSLKQT